MIRLVNSKLCKVVLPNIVVVLSCMMLTLLILDYYNPLMGFLDRGMSLAVIGVWITALGLFIVTFCTRLVLKKISTTTSPRA